MFTDQPLHEVETLEINLETMENWLIVEPNEIEQIQNMSAIATH
ncbi:hypothetical protein [Vibrio sp. M260118]